ncbi:hypothetical protein ACH4D5_31770 [Streptomyces sp. NPDC018029]|uniref:hypothetical protein n=1 Tax=Streptomyces sp. NPDC018029 TaxID=3365032 RepID=UPI0037A5A468
MERISDRLLGTSTSFDLDLTGRPRQVTAENWTEEYAYDAAGNQTQAQWPDEVHRREGRGERTYEGTRLLTAGRIRCEYDAAGRTVLRQKNRLSRKPDTWRYTWDAESRLTACRTPDGTLWTYTYDPLGRRTAKHRMTDDERSILHSVYFTWDGPRVVEQTDTATQTTLTWDYDAYRPLTQLERRTGLDPEARAEIELALLRHRHGPHRRPQRTRRRTRGCGLAEPDDGVGRNVLEP